MATSRRSRARRVGSTTEEARGSADTRRCYLSKTTPTTLLLLHSPCFDGSPEHRRKRRPPDFLGAEALSARPRGLKARAPRREAAEHRPCRAEGGSWASMVCLVLEARRERCAASSVRENSRLGRLRGGSARWPQPNEPGARVRARCTSLSPPTTHYVTALARELRWEDVSPFRCMGSEPHSLRARAPWCGAGQRLERETLGRRPARPRRLREGSRPS